MKKISSTVCDNFESGTDEEVYINFKLDKNFCSTKILDTGKIGDWEINDWARGKTQEWGHETWKNYWTGETQNHNFLGECAKKGFRPNDELKFQVVVPHIEECEILNYVDDRDDVEICFLRVKFGETGHNQTGNIWEWDGRKKGSKKGVWK